LAGITVWNYHTALQGPQIHLVPMQEFLESVFPSNIVPISIVISLIWNPVCIFIAFYLYYYFQGAAISLNAIILFPLLIVVMGILGLGLECLFPLVTKYRDFSYLIGFGVFTDVSFSRGLPYGIG
jgi:lipopolysaccharide transport system permease protein